MEERTTANVSSSSAADSAHTPLMSTEKEVADLLRVSVRTVQGWRYEGRAYPKWILLNGKSVRYPFRALVEWIENDGRTPEARKRGRSFPAKR